MITITFLFHTLNYNVLWYWQRNRRTYMYIKVKFCYRELNTEDSKVRNLLLNVSNTLRICGGQSYVPEPRNVFKCNCFHLQNWAYLRYTITYIQFRNSIFRPSNFHLLRTAVLISWEQFQNEKRLIYTYRLKHCCFTINHSKSRVYSTYQI
jgi:hypothetical protein